MKGINKTQVLGHQTETWEATAKAGACYPLPKQQPSPLIHYLGESKLRAWLGKMRASRSVSNINMLKIRSVVAYELSQPRLVQYCF